MKWPTLGRFEAFAIGLVAGGWFAFLTDSLWVHWLVLCWAK